MTAARGCGRFVLGACVERERPADPHLPSRLVDVAVEGKERLHLLDNLPDGVAPDRDRVRLAADVLSVKSRFISFAVSSLSRTGGRAG